MKYTWSKSFDTSDLNFKDKVSWNRMVLKSMFRSKKHNFRMFLYDKKFFVYNYYNKNREKFSLFLIPITVKYIKYKLMLKGRKIIDIQKSNKSESIYINYLYDGLERNYIQVRVSAHGNPNSKANIFVYV